MCHTCYFPQNLICHTLTLGHMTMSMWNNTVNKRIVFINIIIHEHNKTWKNNILLQFWVKETPFKKKKVSVWHTMKWTSRLWLPKNSGSLHIMIFRYCGNISVSMQRYFLKVKGVKKFMFRCHTLTHGTDLRRLPLILSDIV